MGLGLVLVPVPEVEVSLEPVLEPASPLQEHAPGTSDEMAPAAAAAAVVAMGDHRILDPYPGTHHLICYLMLLKRGC